MPELTTTETTALDVLYRFFKLWGFDQWKQATIGEKLDTVALQKLVEYGLAETKQTNIADVRQQCKTLRDKLILSVSLMAVPASEREVMHHYRITPEGVFRASIARIVSQDN